MKTVAAASASDHTPTASGVDGLWRLSVQTFEEETAARLELFATDGTLSGSVGDLIVKGVIEDGTMTFTATHCSGRQYAAFDGRVEAGALGGTVRVGEDEFAWTAIRHTRPAVPPQTRIYEPVVFQHEYAATLEPVLRVNPGDTVRTSTVDNGGRDAQNIRRTGGGNPLTGPFYVEGALPGDTLIVTLNDIRVNRTSARSGNRLTPEAVTPDYYRSAQYQDSTVTDWTLDADSGVATVATASARLKHLRLKIEPFLGCIGVAPVGKQAYRAYSGGSFGGNMDYSRLRPGTRLYLPVYHPGALLFVGDGHAAQGDGELTGDALETSLNVEFTVDLISGLVKESVSGPFAENDEWLMAIGIAGSLPSALRTATTQLATWLGREYQLHPNETAVLLGTSLHYDVAGICGPQMAVVARIGTHVLAQLDQ